MKSIYLLNAEAGVNYFSLMISTEVEPTAVVRDTLYIGSTIHLWNR